MGKDVRLKEAAEAHAKLTSELKASQLELMAADVKKSDAIRAADTASSNASRAAVCSSVTSPASTPRSWSAWSDAAPR